MYNDKRQFILVNGNRKNISRNQKGYFRIDKVEIK